jgi:hypothetical protein
MVPEDLMETNRPDTAFLHNTGEDYTDHQDQSDDAGHRMADPARFCPEGKHNAHGCYDESGHEKNVRQV